MKKSLWFTALLIVLVSCDVILVDPVYDDRDRVTGTYRVEEYSETFDEYAHYTVWISKSGYSSDVIVENFYGANLRVRAEVSGNRIHIPWQVRDGYEIAGSGAIFGDEVRLTYKVTDTYDPYAATDFCESEAWRSY